VAHDAGEGSGSAVKLNYEIPATPCRTSTCIIISGRKTNERDEVQETQLACLARCRRRSAVTDTARGDVDARRKA
jgi:hypothetical protein